MSQAWNPSDKDASITLSNDNLTVRGGGLWNAVRAVNSVSSGKWYWEIVQDDLSGGVYGTMFGTGTSVFSLASYPGASHEGWSLYFFNNNAEGYHNGRGAASGGSSGVGSVYMVALDMDNNKIWFGVNGTWLNSGNPAAGTNEAYALDKTPLFPAVAGNSGNTARFTGDFSYAPPSGFSGFPPPRQPWPDMLNTPRRDRFRRKGISLGPQVEADTTSFLITSRNRFRTEGISTEPATACIPPFAPDSISGLLAWYAADQIVGKSDGNAMSQWDDLSGNARHMLQAQEGRRPLYKIEIVNGLPALLFDSGDDVMATVASLTGMCTVVAVAKYVGANFGSYNGLFTGASDNIWFIGSAGSADWYTNESGGQAFYKDNVQTYGSVVNAWHCFIATYPAGRTHVAQIGRDRVYDGRCWGGYIAEVAIYGNVLSVEDRTTLDAYLRAKYAIA